MVSGTPPLVGNRAARILVADDEPSIRWLLDRLLRRAGHSVTVVEDGAAAVTRAEAEPFDLAFLDVRMPGLDGLEALSQLRVQAPDTAVIVMTAHGSVRTAVEAMQRGAYDYLTKPFDNDEVRLLVDRALSARALAREVVELRTGIQEVWEFGALVGQSPRMQEVYKTIGRIAGTDVTILLRGESGTGKEVVARAVHHYSRRAGKPFVAVPCAAIPATLLESELFGHEKGAFTDAHQRRLGKFELAQGGTIYLDEVGDLGAELQPKLLRVLQEREFERVGGGGDPVRVDVRVVAATNRDLETLIGDGRFREDLYYRLNVVTLTLPPLRERPEDIPFLVDHFLVKYAGELGERAVSAEGLDRLTGYAWPGNVRELENVIQHAMVMAGGGVILAEHLPIAPGAGPRPVVQGTIEQLVEQKLAECVRGLGTRESANLYDLVLGLLERPLLRAVLRETGGNQLRAAALLGINRNTLRKKLRALGIRAEGDAEPPDSSGSGGHPAS